MEGKKITTSILPLAIDLKEIERWRSKEQGKLKRTLGLGWDFLFSRKLQEEEERENDSSLYRQWPWVPLLRQLLGLKTPTSGPWMDSTKKEELIVEISSFQKVYISQISETSKIVSRFCAKRLFYPYN